MTTEDSIDLNDLDYDWQLSEAISTLENFMKAFSIQDIGLTDEVLHSVCPEADEKLVQCFDSYRNEQLKIFYNECILYIEEIFPRGKADLIELLGNTTKRLTILSSLFEPFRQSILADLR